VQRRRRQQQVRAVLQALLWAQVRQFLAQRLLLLLQLQLLALPFLSARFSALLLKAAALVLAQVLALVQV
jgi:hypothetical protein